MFTLYPSHGHNYFIEDGEFIMAFARRNVPMDRVLEAAEAAGFVWEILDDIHGYNAMEPVYRFALHSGKK